MDDTKKLIHEDRAMQLMGMRRCQLRAFVANVDGIRQRVGNAYYYSFAEVTKFAQIRSRAYQDDVSIPEKVEVLRMEVQRLSRMVRNLSQVAGLGHAFWEPSDDELYKTYEKINTLVNTYGPHKAPSPDRVNQILAVVSRFTEHEFYRLHQRYRNDLFPWVPFYKVCYQMLHALKIKNVKTMSDDTSVLQHRVLLCIDALRRSAALYCGIVQPSQPIPRTMSLALQAHTISEIELMSMQTEDPVYIDAASAVHAFIDD